MPRYLTIRLGSGHAVILDQGLRLGCVTVGLGLVLGLGLAMEHEIGLGFGVEHLQIDIPR